jgi:hypothetical protein
VRVPPGCCRFEAQEFDRMNVDDAPVSPTANQPLATSIGHLTSRDIDRLTNYKWRYSLESHGFSSDQAARLLFIKWLYGRGRIGV